VLPPPRLISIRISALHESGDVNIKSMPLLHRFPFWYSWNGFRGSQFIWAIFGIFQKLPDAKIVQLPNSFPMIVSERDWISKTIYQGTYERPLLHFLKSLVLTNVMLDVGANIGVTLWHTLRNSSKDTGYLAFEPSKQCAPGLNLVTSHLHNEGRVLSYAIGDTDGNQALHGIENPFHSGGASLIEHSGLRGETELVEVRKLDSLAAAFFEGQSVALLKIDTEGYESHVIDGAKNLLESGKVEIIVMEVSPNFGDVSYLRTIKGLVGARYDWFALEEIGKFKRNPSLDRISLDASINRPRQWNLVLIRVDIFENYCKLKHPIFLNAKNQLK
jgi:FkbM family methyltransferase